MVLMNRRSNKEHVMIRSLMMSTVVMAATILISHAETYNYSCNVCVFPTLPTSDGSDGCDVVSGKTYPLRVDDNKNVLEWRGKKYKLTEAEDCGRIGWHVEGNGTSFDFCTATQGYGAIQDKDGVTRVRCNLKR
jgi:hypothetical protein